MTKNDFLSKRKLLLFASIVIGAFLFSFFLFPYFIPKILISFKLTSSNNDTINIIAGLTGPIISFFGIILTFMAFYIQYVFNEIQTKVFRKQQETSDLQHNQLILQQFESNYFQLLNLHRENVLEMHYRDVDSRYVFLKMMGQLFEVFERLDQKFDFQKELSNQDLINIGYIIFYYGLEEEVEDVLKTKFLKKYPQRFERLYDTINDLRQRPNPNEKYKQYKFYYNGHQSRLGHYFRHLYKTISFVDQNDFLIDQQKMNYIDIIKAQLSNHEQSILFFFAISDLGTQWKQTNDLITKYNLIQNLSIGNIYNINPRKYFPDVDFTNYSK